MGRLILCFFMVFCLVSPSRTPAPRPLLDLAAPTDLVAEAISPTEIRLTWTDNASGEQGYRVMYSLDGGWTWPFYPLLPADTTSWTDANRVPCSHAVYLVVAHHDAGSSPSSNWAAATTPSDASAGIETIWSESFENGVVPPGWVNPGGWLVNTGGPPYEGTYKAMISYLTGGVLRSRPIDCSGAAEITISFWALSTVFNTEMSYYRVYVQGEGDPVLLDGYFHTAGAWAERTYTITDPALLTPSTTVLWDAHLASSERAYLDMVTITRPVPIAPPTAITRQPEDATLCGASSAAFEVEATGQDLAYRWQRHPGTGWADIPGADGPRLELTGLSSTDSGHRVRAAVSGACATAYSYPATLTVGAGGGTITAQPEPQAACAGGEAAFSLSAEGEGLVYRWQRDGQDLVDSERVQGTGSSLLTIAALEPPDAGAYRCRVGDDACGALSDAASLTVWRSLRILTEPQNVTVCPGEDATFAVSAEGDGLAYQWQFEGVDLPGEEGATLVLPAVSPEEAGGYRCMLSGTCGTLASSTATLSVGAPPAIALDPQGSVVEEGQGATFTVLAEGTGLAYQWETSADGGLTYTPIPGAQGPTYASGPLAIADDGRLYRCRVQGTCGSATSLPAEATVLRVQEIPLEAGWQIASLNVVPLDGATEVLFAGVAGQVASVYAWREGAWRLYTPETPEGSDLVALAPGEGFWVHATSPAALRIAGRVPAETEIPLGAGWTLTGFPAGAPRALPEALGDAGAAPDLLYGYGPAGAWRHHDPSAPSWASTLQALVPGQGYWIRTAQETIWTVAY